MPKDYERVRDQIHGFIQLSKREMQIVDTRVFQRLRRIHQLAFTHFIYPGAEHTRFAHSLGVMDLATRVFDALWERSQELQSLGPGTKAHLRQLLRLYALLHDIGHGPFSHAGDGLFPPGSDHEEYSRRLVVESDIASIITEIGDELHRHHPDEPRITPELVGSMIVGTGLDPRYHLLRQIMTSEADADKMDYLLRDSYNCGVSYGQYDLERLLQSFVARPADPRPSNRTFQLCINVGGVNAFEAFVLARYWMFLQVYFHRTRRIYDIFLERFFREYFNGGLPQDLDEFLEYDDYVMWGKITQAQQSNQWAHGIVNRAVWSQVFESPSHAAEGDVVKFRLLKRELNRMFNGYYIIDHAKKAPHKLPALFDPENVKTIALVDDDGRPLDLNRQSEILRRVAAPINKYRVYAHPSVAEQVKALCDEIHATAENE